MHTVDNPGVAVGLANGSVALYDVRATSTPLVTSPQVLPGAVKSLMWRPGRTTWSRRSTHQTVDEDGGGGTIVGSGGHRTPATHADHDHDHDDHDDHDDLVSVGLRSSTSSRRDTTGGGTTTTTTTTHKSGSDDQPQEEKARTANRIGFVVPSMVSSPTTSPRKRWQAAVEAVQGGKGRRGEKRGGPSPPPVERSGGPTSSTPDDPGSTSTSSTKTVHVGLTEADVRRIVREEVAGVLAREVTRPLERMGVDLVRQVHTSQTELEGVVEKLRKQLEAAVGNMGKRG